MGHKDGSNSDESKKALE